MTDGPFSTRTLSWLIALCTASFLGALGLSIFASEKEAASWGTDTYSRAALGHLAFVELLRELGVPVMSSRYASARRAGDEALLVVAEPHDCPPDSTRARQLRKMLRSSARTLLVLPKWRGVPDDENRAWVQTVELVDGDEVDHVLEAAEVRVGVTREVGVPPTGWAVRRAFSQVPTLPLDTVQLLDGRDLKALITCPRGVLLAEIERPRGRLLVLSDPDLLANGGLGRGANAALAVEIVDQFRPEGGAVIFDETLHGYERPPSLWRELFSFPLAVLMVQGLVVLLVLLWAGMGRFGSPERPPPPLEPGHRFLIRNTAELLRYRGHVETVLPLYLENTLQDARKALGAPPGMDGDRLEAWLDRVAAVRGAERSVGSLKAEVGAAVAGRPRSGRVLDAARQIHRWNQEIRHGPSDRTEPA